MNIIDYAVAEVKAQINPQILEKAYPSLDSYGFKSISQDEYIRKNIIQCRVMRDCNILGGQELYIETQDAIKIKQIDETALYVFKPTAWKGNGLISVTDFRSWGAGGDGCSYGCNSSAMTQAEVDTLYGTRQPIDGLYGDAYKHARRQVDQKTGNYNIGGSTLLRVYGDNAIGILNVLTPPIGVFTVIIGHDKELRDMGRRDAIYFSKMAVAAVKADIYNTTLLTLAQGDASRGYILTSVSDVINSYSDAESDYQALRLGWGARAFEADPLRHDEFINDQISFLDVEF